MFIPTFIAFIFFVLFFGSLKNNNKLKVVVTDDKLYQFGLPKYETHGSAGLDLRTMENLSIAPGERKLVDTGLRISVPWGCEGQLRPRSGNALKKGITVLNSPATIDCDYTGDLKVLLLNTSKEVVTFQFGDRIAQLVVTPYVKCKVVEVEELTKTERGVGGWGSTKLQ